MDDFDLVMKFDQDGPETDEEAAAMALLFVRTGLINSAGRYGRFVRRCLDAGLLTDDEVDAVRRLR